MRFLALALLICGAAAASAAEKKTVNLDVKDAEARPVLKSLQKQCGIKNLIIDPDVTGGSATFYFREVPCETAFRIVLRTYGLTAQIDLPKIVTVGVRPN